MYKSIANTPDIVSSNQVDSSGSVELADTYEWLGPALALGLALVVVLLILLIVPFSDGGDDPPATTSPATDPPAVDPPAADPPATDQVSDQVSDTLVADASTEEAAAEHDLAIASDGSATYEDVQDELDIARQESNAANADALEAQVIADGNPSDSQLQVNASDAQTYADQAASDVTSIEYRLNNYRLNNYPTCNPTTTTGWSQWIPNPSAFDGGKPHIYQYFQSNDFVCASPGYYNNTNTNKFECDSNHIITPTPCLPSSGSSDPVSTQSYCNIPSNAKWTWSDVTPTSNQQTVATPSCSGYLTLTPSSGPWKCIDGTLTPTPTCKLKNIWRECYKWIREDIGQCGWYGQHENGLHHPHYHKNCAKAVSELCEDNRYIGCAIPSNGSWSAGINQVIPTTGDTVYPTMFKCDTADGYSQPSIPSQFSCSYGSLTPTPCLPSTESGGGVIDGDNSNSSDNGDTPTLCSTTFAESCPTNYFSMPTWYPCSGTSCTKRDCCHLVGTEQINFPTEGDFVGKVPEGISSGVIPTDCSKYLDSFTCHDTIEMFKCGLIDDRCIPGCNGIPSEGGANQCGTGTVTVRTTPAGSSPSCGRNLWKNNFATCRYSPSPTPSGKDPKALETDIYKELKDSERPCRWVKPTTDSSSNVNYYNTFDPTDYNLPSNQTFKDLSVVNPTCDTIEEGFQNYVPQPLKETTNWFACRPDINENSKISLLPGFEF